MILPAESLPLDSYDIVDLIKLRARIDKMLPQTGDMNLSHELVLQFQVAKKLQLDAQDDDEIPLNQKAQLINSSAALLKQLAEYQTRGL